jgi:ATP-dependent Clp protease ATP-binding subunit ClpA
MRVPDDDVPLLRLAEAEALARAEDHVATEHVLLALLQRPPVERAIERLGVPIDRVRADALALLPPHANAPSHGRLPFAPKVKEALERSLEESAGGPVALSHLVLGLRAVRCRAADVLAAHGLDAALLRSAFTEQSV